MKVCNFVVYSLCLSCPPRICLPRSVAVETAPAKREANTAAYWRLHGEERPLARGTAARTVFVCPSSAGVMERDFCIADMFLARKHGSLDLAVLEIFLCLRAQYEYIPDDARWLSDVDAKTINPERLRTRQMLDECQDIGLVPDEESEAEDVRDQSVQWFCRTPCCRNRRATGTEGPQSGTMGGRQGRGIEGPQPGIPKGSQVPAAKHSRHQ